MKKVLYAVQGTGNGHVSRACYVIPEIQKYAEVDILISGYQSDITLPFEVKYAYYGLSFIFGKHGGVDIAQTLKQAKIFRFFRDISNVPVEKYDLVINDFEPITAWACKKKKIPCISLSHQSAVVHPKAPKPKKKDILGTTVLIHYAPTHMQFGVHFKQYSNTIYTPVIRTDIRNAEAKNLGHYTVYLPAYDDALLTEIGNAIPDVSWHIFSKRIPVKTVLGNVTIEPVSHAAFAQSMISSEGVFCGAGFETPAEALFLGKKLMVIPMKNQYEQQCNAEALLQLGVPVLYSLDKKSIPKIKQWVIFGETLQINYKNNIPNMVQAVFNSLTN